MASVLITGTSKGIGYETALAFARAGYTVHATMRNSAQSSLAKVATAEKLPITVTPMDVDSDQSVQAACAAILQHGPLDVLVNNAGIERAGAVEELSLDDFRAVMETNYFGAIRCIQAVLPQMRGRRSGCIINVSSVAGRLSNPPLVPYVASKWALEALSEGLAAEMKPFNVRVAIVEPGIIDTAMARRIEQDGHVSHYAQRTRFARLFQASLKSSPSPSLVAEKILEVASGGAWQLRHPVGPDAVPLLKWRGSFTDEQWIGLHAADDETWYQVIQRDFGMDTRPKKSAAAQE